MKNIKGINVGFLQQVTGNKSQRLGDDTWQNYGADSVLQVAVIKPLRYYINKRQLIVAEWVSLRPIFEVYAKETGYEVRWWEGGGVGVEIRGGDRCLQSNI